MGRRPTTVEDTSDGYAPNTNSVSFSHDSSGENRLLLVGISYRPTVTITSVTYNGQALTAVRTAREGTYAGVIIYKMVNPPVGTYTVAVSFSTIEYASVGAVTLSGVDQTTPYNYTYFPNSYSYGSTQQITVNNTTSGDFVFGVIDVYLTSPTAQSGTNMIYEANSAYSYGEGAYKTATGSTTTLNWTTGSNQYYAYMAMIVKQATVSQATFALGEDSKVGLEKESPIRLRFLVENTGAVSSGETLYQLEVAETGTCSSGTYYAVGGDTGAGADWEMVDSGYVTDGGATSNLSSVLTDPGREKRLRPAS